ncbi:MAG TPA: Ku protein [Ensifer sp.]|jgi:DNA end-binding protein Ku|uniref:non-homologous end joining protein Ku n=1 Tax=Ensifer sp. TaxID=1872086 RepID=UPI002E11604A|nr:Ku protein [Ensifer sp.]
MAPRPYWKGYLKLSLVTCPVALAPATSENEKVRFHTLNRETGNRVVSRYVDADSGKPVVDEDIAKGYEFEPERFVVIDDEDLESVALQSVRTIEIEMFVARDSIPWVYLDSPYYLTPNDEVGEEAFCVIRDAMAASKVVGLSRLVLGRRERAVMLEARDNGIVLWTLRYRDEVRDETAYFGGIDELKPETALIELAQSFIKAKSKDWSPAMVQDPVQEHLLKLIASKRKGARRAKSPSSAAAKGGNVVNLFEALKKSLAEDAGKGQVGRRK